MLLGMVFLWILPEPDAANAILHYAPFHTSIEMVSVAISAMIFGAVWTTQRYKPDGRILVLGLGFLGVGLLDWSHALSYVTMPQFFTVNTSEKAINFWLMARLWSGLVFLLIAFWPSRLAKRRGYGSRYLALAVMVVIVVASHFIVLYYQDSIPSTYTEGVGLTAFKINFEYFLIALYVAAGLGFLAKARGQLDSSNLMLALASFVMAMSEFFFTRYANVADTYNMAGHVYKIIAYGFLYRAVFLVTVRQPFESLKESQTQYVATLNTLPDSLFEVDRRGVYRSIHANNAGYSAESWETAIGKRLDQTLPKEAARVSYEAIDEADRTGTSRGHRIVLKMSDGLRHFELSVAKKSNPHDEAATFLVLSRNITATVANEQKVRFEARLNSMLLELQARAEYEQKADFLKHATTLIQELMDSPIAYMYEADEDQSSLKLLACSDEWLTQAGMSPLDVSLSLNDLGKWADALRNRRSTMLDGQLGAADSKGLMTWHVDLQRLVTVPVLEGGQVRLLVGVANKSQGYTHEEVTALQLLASTFWATLEQRRKTTLIRQLSEALEQSPHSIIITDVNAKIKYVNRAFCESSGYSSREVLGKNPKFLQSGDTPRAFYEQLWQRLTHSQSWQGEFTNKRKNGTTYVELVSMYPITDQFGVVTQYVAHKVDITQSKITEKRIRELSDYDSLTGLLNNKSFNFRLGKAILDAKENNELLSLMWFNLDNFKLINDSLGHDLGDEFLVNAANLLLERMGERYIVARHSGDTFVAIVPREPQSVVAVVATDILNKLRLPIQLGSQNVSVGASVGIAVFPDDAKTAAKLSSCAEIAMYRAKEDGRNNVRFFASAMQKHTQRSLELAISLTGAHERGELHLVYQPQFDATSGQVVGAEALLRWQHPKWGLVSPGEFIPLAEQTGLIVPIGFWVVEQVARQVHQWQSLGMSNLLVAINVSAIQFVRTGFVPELIKVLSKADVPTSCIEIEITEAVALKNPGQAVGIIHELHAAGFQIALDDFGTGYSSLNYLRRYSINKLKIDQSFVNELDCNEGDQSIVTAIIQMSQGLGMKTIAEGVETAEQAQILKALGCDEFQGYWLSLPVSAAELEILLKQQGSESQASHKIRGLQL